MAQTTSSVTDRTNNESRDVVFTCSSMSTGVCAGDVMGLQMVSQFSILPTDCSVGGCR